MIKKTCLLILSSLCLSTALCQQKFEPGYIVTLNKDTVEGQILNEIDSKLAFKIKFKSALNSVSSETEAVKEYSPEELAGFQFSNGRVFEQLYFKNSSNDSTLIFAKKILSGKVDMWIWRNESRPPRVILRNNESGIIVHLSKREKKTLRKDGKKYAVNDVKFIGLMNYVMSDENKPNSKRKIFRYTEKSIYKRVKKYNEDFETNFVSTAYEEETNFKYDVAAGIATASFSRNNYNNIRISIFRRKTRPEKSNRLSSNSGIAYNGWFDNSGYTGSFRNGVFDYRWQMFNIVPLGIHYQFNDNKIAPYLRGGVGLSAIVITSYIVNDGMATGSQRDITPKLSLLLSGGIKYNTGSKSLFVEITPTINSVYLSAGFSF